jgi:indole-3-glycerol phosphate synthase
VGFLTEAVDRVRRDLERRPIREGTLLLQTRSLPAPIDLDVALRAPGIGVIAEVKRASPSAGALAPDEEPWEPGARAAGYQAGGAAAVSVLTEPRHFGGTLRDLRDVRRRTTLPILRKDFIVHPAQVLEARAEGADAVLLIAAALTVTEIRELRVVAEDLGMSALVEVHEPDDLDRAMEAGSSVIGVNARDLETLQVDLRRAVELLAVVPAEVIRVLESGVSGREDVLRAEAAGADAVLVGETLMRASDPVAKLEELLGRRSKAASR